jgi:hypothetical protein
MITVVMIRTAYLISILVATMALAACAAPAAEDAMLPAEMAPEATTTPGLAYPVEAPPEPISGGQPDIEPEHAAPTEGAIPGSTAAPGQTSPEDAQMGPISVNQPTILAAALATDVDPNTREPIGVATVFPSDIPHIYVRANATAPAGTTFTSLWSMVRPDGTRMAFAEVSTQAAEELGPNGWVWFRVRGPQGQWQAGQYEVTILIENSPGVTLPFEVAPPAPMGGQAAVLAVTMAADTNPNTGAPVGVGANFLADTPLIYLTAWVQGPEGTQFGAQWFVIMQDGSRAPFSQYTFQVGHDLGTGTWVWFREQGPQGRWQTGNYEVTLLVENHAVVTIPFTVWEQTVSGPPISQSAPAEQTPQARTPHPQTQQIAAAILEMASRQQNSFQAWTNPIPSFMRSRLERELMEQLVPQQFSLQPEDIVTFGLLMHHLETQQPPSIIAVDASLERVRQQHNIPSNSHRVKGFRAFWYSYASSNDWTRHTMDANTVVQQFELYLTHKFITRQGAINHRLAGIVDSETAWRNAMEAQLQWERQRRTREEVAMAEHHAWETIMHSDAAIQAAARAMQGLP